MLSSWYFTTDSFGRIKKQTRLWNKKCINKNIGFWNMNKTGFSIIGLWYRHRLVIHRLLISFHWIGEYCTDQASTVRTRRVLYGPGEYCTDQASTLRTRRVLYGPGEYCTDQASTVRTRRVPYGPGEYCTDQASTVHNLSRGFLKRSIP